MLYKINNKYYVRVAPMRYTEVNFILKNDDVVIQLTQHKIESNGQTVIKEFDFQKEKESIKKSLQDTLHPEKKTTRESSAKHRRRS